MRHLAFLLSIFWFVSCVTLDENAAKEPPAITADMPMIDAFNAAIEFGGRTLHDAKKVFEQRKEWAEVNRKITSLLPSAMASYSNSQLINLLHLYQASTNKASIEIFNTLITSNRPMARILGWNLAANFPSAEMKSAIDEEFTRRMLAGEEEVLYEPAMALAVQANQLTSSYTVVREGFFHAGDETFARAMIALDPRQASDDFLDYLAKASVEELRQLNQKEVNVYSCLLALRHMTVVPASINHPHFSHLFLYAVSRNQGLADLAHIVLERSVGSHTQYLAILLSQLPDWIQVAYVESARQRMSPTVQTFIAALKEATPHTTVVEEIQSVR